MKACFMGLGYIGLPTAIIAAEHGIEVIGAVGALSGADHRDADDIAHDLFQRLTMLFVHRQQEEGQHHEHHAQGCRTVSSRATEQKEQRYAQKRPSAETD